MFYTSAMLWLSGSMKRSKFLPSGLGKPKSRRAGYKDQATEASAAYSALEFDCSVRDSGHHHRYQSAIAIIYAGGFVLSILCTIKANRTENTMEQKKLVF